MKCCFLFRFLFIRAKFKSTENSSCGSRWVERSMAFSSLHDGMCSSTDTRVLRKGGGHLAKSATLPAVFQAPVRPGIVNLVHSNLHRSNKLLSVAQQLIKPSGYWRSRGSNSQGLRRRDSPFRPGCFWKYGLWGPPVCTNQDMATLAPQSKYICGVFHLLCSGCLGPTSAGHAKGHRVEGVPAPHKAEGYKKTKEAVLLLKKQKVWNDITEVCAARRMGAGQGEMRSRIQRKGPCLIDNTDNGIIKAFRNIPGITPLNISKLNNFETCSWRSCGTFLHLD